MKKLTKRDLLKNTYNEPRASPGVEFLQMLVDNKALHKSLSKYVSIQGLRELAKYEQQRLAREFERAAKEREEQEAEPTIEKLRAAAIAELREVVKDEGFKVAEDRIFEIADSYVPVYNINLAKLIENNLYLGCTDAENAPEECNAFKVIGVVVEEDIAEALSEELGRLREAKAEEEADAETEESPAEVE